MTIGFLPQLHGLRAVAALSVLLFHWSQLFPGVNIWIAQTLVPNHLWVNPILPWSMGWQGVSLFFVLSGYLLTTQWVDRAITFQAVVHFYKRRILRIYPAAWLQLTMLFFFAAMWPGLFEQASWHSWLINASLWINLPPWFKAPLNGVWWTLPIELMFYLLLPFLIVFQRRFGLALFFVGMLFVTVSWRWWVMLRYAGQDLSSVLTVLDALPGVLLTFGAGFSAALMQGKLKSVHARPLLWVSMIIFFVLQTILVHYIEFYWQGGWLLCLWNSLLAMTMAGAVSAFCHRTESTSVKILSKRSMVVLGDWSFGIYLWHFPVLQVLQRLYPDRTTDALSSLWALCVTLAVTLAFSALSFICLEKPLMRAIFSGTTGRMNSPIFTQ